MTTDQILRSQKGFTLVEVMIAALILGMIVLVWASLESFTSQAIKKASDFSMAQKIMLSITNDVLRSEKGLPPIEPPPQLAKVAFSRSELQLAYEDLDNANKLRRICYDNRGNLIINAANLSECYYNVTYFKYRLDDLGYKTNAIMKQIPLSRVSIRVIYLDPAVPENFKPGTPKEKLVMTTRYLTRLVSNVAEF